MNKRLIFIIKLLNHQTHFNILFFIMITSIIPLILLLIPPLLYLLLKPKPSCSNLPPGSLGIPYIGESLNLLRAMWANKAEQWLADRVEKYGPVSKLTLFGAPTVLLTGPTANRLIFTNEAVVPQQPKSVPRIIGRRNMLELHGEDHKRVRGAVSQFLRVDVLKMYVGRIDGEVRGHIEKNWTNRPTVKVLPLLQRLTFDIICSLLIGIEPGPIRDDLSKDFIKMIAGMWAIPINLPFTNFQKSLKASKRARNVLASIVKARKLALKQGQCDLQEDLITYLIGMDLSDEEVVDNAVLVMVAGYDTSSHLITFIIRHLANDHATLSLVTQEQEMIAKGKVKGEALSWDDLSRMKYTWRVAMEILRMIPPLFGSFRRTLKDLDYNGYTIPKGWQVFWATSITHMDPNIFPDPEKFDPTRFEKAAPTPPYCYIPFGGGPRLCPGNEFARIETLVMIHHLVTRFNWKLCCKDDTFIRDPMPSPREGLPIQLEMKS